LEVVNGGLTEGTVEEFENFFTQDMKEAEELQVDKVVDLDSSLINDFEAFFRQDSSGESYVKEDLVPSFEDFFRQVDLNSDHESPQSSPATTSPNTSHSHSHYTENAGQRLSEGPPNFPNIIGPEWEPPSALVALGQASK
jgi:hypothetical protein